MPYHVRITTKSKPSHDEVKLDLTNQELERRFLLPYNEGRSLVIGGKTIPPDDIERIRITYTDETSEKLLRVVRAEHEHSLVIGGPSDEWYVADRGRDVTDELITAPPGTGTLPRREKKVAVADDPRRVSVVYGRNLKARNALFQFLRSIDLFPIEWSQAVAATKKTSPYIGEVLDQAFSMGQAVVVLMTGDDEARLRQPFRKPGDPPYETELTPQARPNVLFEAGMAMGRHDNRSVLVQIGEIRPFSDIGGRHVIKLDNTLEMRQQLAQRLEAAGCPVDLSGTDWHSEGDFDLGSAQVLTEGTKNEEAEQDSTQRSRLEAFNSRFERFLRRLEVKWKAERDSKPTNTNKGRRILERASSEVVKFASEIVPSEENSKVAEIFDEAATRLQAIQRRRSHMGAGHPASAVFWLEGTRIIRLLKRVPEEIKKILNH